MINFTPGLAWTWQIAANEASDTKHPFIEKEHLFIALCKVTDLLHPDAFGQIEGLNKNMLKAEFEALEKVFVQLNIDRTMLRRRLRAIVGKGGYRHTENVVHRSEECKGYFKKAEERAVLYKSPEVNIFHLLAVIIENPGLHIANAFSDLKINAQEIKNAVEGIGRELGEAVHAFAKADYPPENAGHASKTPYLDRYGRDVTRLAKEGRLEAVVERRRETLQIIRTLTKGKKNNPLLIGEPGVGKTAIVEGLALRISKGNITPLLRNKRIIELNIGSLIAGTKYRGEFEERINGIIAEAKANSDIILFIDEIHTLIGAGKGGDALDAANIMKPALGRGDIACIGATTISEYRKYIEKDPALERRFQQMMVNEPGPEEAIKILNNLAESWKDVRVDASAIKAAVDLSVKYIPDRRLPDKAIDILEEAYSRVKVPQLSVYGDSGKEATVGIITAGLVSNVVSELAGIPVDRLNKAEKEHLLNMAEGIKKRVIGQDEAVEKVVQVVKMQMVGLKDGKRPVGVFLFLGPTGVGKTELAKGLAEFLFGSEDELIRLDMSEYMEKHSVSKFIGAPPGYIGHDEEGQLTGRLRSKPYSVVLLDEIEKAHPEIFDLFLQVFDEGRLTDSKGRTIDATNALFIMTSNIGTGSFHREPVGFIHPDSEEGKTAKADIQSKLGQTFRAEFLNRIDDIIYFKPLNKDEIISIALNMLDEIRKRLEDKGIGLKIEEKALKLICEEGDDPANGARPLRRAIERLIVKPLSGKLLSDEFIEEDMIIVDAEDGRIVFSKGSQLLEKKEEWMRTMETADDKTIFDTLEKEINIAEFIGDSPKEIAIMFTDLKGCGVYFGNEGTELAMEWINRHSNILTPVIRSHGGIVVKKICDAIMAIFKDPKKSVIAAIEMQKAIKNHNETEDEAERYFVRISLNAGRVSLHQKHDVAGTAVNIAARIDKKIAKPERIFIGQNLYEIIKNEQGIKTEFSCEEKFAEEKEDVKIYEVLWQEMG